MSHTGSTPPSSRKHVDTYIATQLPNCVFVFSALSRAIVVQLLIALDAETRLLALRLDLSLLRLTEQLLCSNLHRRRRTVFDPRRTSFQRHDRPTQMRERRGAQRAGCVTWPCGWGGSTGACVWCSAVACVSFAKPDASSDYCIVPRRAENVGFPDIVLTRILALHLTVYHFLFLDCSGSMDSTQQTPPVKLACVTCIQGHRASTCKHQDGSKGPLQVVKRRGRPLSQCATCREKRQRTGRHTRCDCKAKQASDDKKKEAATPVSTRGLDPAPAASTAASTVMPCSGKPTDCRKRDPLSFEFLVNPCQCSAGGRCTCCDSDAMSAAPVPKNTKLQSPKIPLAQPRLVPILPIPTSMPVSTAHFGQRGVVPAVTPSRVARLGSTSKYHPFAKPLQPKSCCSRSTYDAASTMAALQRAADMTRPYKPECTCSGGCACKGCTARAPNDAAFMAMASTAPGCKSCVACDVRLEGSSSLEPVDHWFAMDRTPSGSVASATI